MLPSRSIWRGFNLQLLMQILMIRNNYFQVCNNMNPSIKSPTIASSKLTALSTPYATSTDPIIYVLKKIKTCGCLLWRSCFGKWSLGRNTSPWSAQTVSSSTCYNCVSLSKFHSPFTVPTIPIGQIHLAFLIGFKSWFSSETVSTTRLHCVSHLPSRLTFALSSSHFPSEPTIQSELHVHWTFAMTLSHSVCNRCCRACLALNRSKCAPQPFSS